MKRGPLIIVIFVIEMIVGLILFFNYRYLIDRLRPVATPSTLETLPAGNVQVAVNAAAPQVQLPASLSPGLLSLFDILPPEAPPLTYQLSDALINLGRVLYYEPRLSVNQTQSCNTCHPLDRYGMDSLPLSMGHNGAPLKRNTPTVYNAALHIAQFWDGRSPIVEEQAKGPILASGEMGMLDAAAVESALRAIPGYAPLFAAAFPGDPNPITFDHVAQAIGAFERRLMTPARFDQFLAGDYNQFTAQEQRGFATFAELGCPNCHVGVTVGGLQFKKLGEKEPYPVDDDGRFTLTNLEVDRHVFKVPSLRNVAQTAPYLHDGSIQTLEEMVILMARYQLARAVTPEQVTDIVAFLQTLTGEIPRDYIAPPALP